MATEKLATLQITTTAEAKHFITSFRDFMANAAPNAYIGVKTIEYRLEINVLEGECAYDLSYESNVKMNQGSRARVRDLAKGFVGGWQSNK